MKLVRDLGMRYPKETSKTKRHFAVYECKHCKDNFTDRMDSIELRKGCQKCAILMKDIKLKALPQKIMGIKVIKDLGMSTEKKPKREAIFECFCGNHYRAKINAVATEQKKSCGCYQMKFPNNKIHGLVNHRLYRKWSGMKTRTTNPKDSHWHRYGGRGISICSEWFNDFKSFYDWSIANGYKEGLTIDRINNDGNYEPSNCQWITFSENARKDSLKFNPSEKTKKEICNLYVKTHTTIRKLAKEYKTHVQRISHILKENNIQIVHRRMKCY